MFSSQRKKCGILQLGSKAFFIYEGLNLVGRNRDAAVILKDPIASIHHAIITVINECHYVSDVTSTNGTKLDGKKLVPLHVYALDEGSKLEFTPNLLGIYKIIPRNPSQTLLMSQIESQTTQTPEGLFGANTQLESMPVFGDDDEMEQEMSKIVVDTQIINDIMCRKSVDNTETKELQGQAKKEIYEMETQVLDLVPSINEVATQINEHQTSMLSAFTDTQCFTENNDNAVGNSEQGKEYDNVLIHAEDPMVAKVCNELSGETSKALNLAEDAPANDKHESNGDSGSETDVDEEYVAEIASRSKHCSVLNLSTQTVGSEADTQAKIKSQASICSLNLQYSATQPNDDPDGNSNSSDCFLTGGTSMSLNSALKLVKDSQPELEGQKTQERKVEETSESAESGEKGRLCHSNKRSEDIFDSEDEAFSFGKGLKVTSNMSNARRSRFVLSDSEEETVEDKQNKNESKTTYNESNLPNDTMSECEDSFVQRKSVGNLTSECIPPTQDVSFQVAENESLKIGLSKVVEVSELDITALQGDVSKKTVGLGGMEESIVESSSIDEGLESETSVGDVTIHLNIIAPAQPHCANQSPSHAISDKQDCDFDACTQQLPSDGVAPNVHEGKLDDEDEDADFFAPTQDVLHDAKAVDEDGFRLPTQPAREFSKSRKELRRNSAGERNDTQPNDCDFDAATQQLRPDAAGDAEASDQRLGEDEDDLFLAPTQSLIEEKSKEPKRVGFQVSETLPATDNKPAIVQPPKIPNVESQLEVMFESQNVSLSAADPSRPSNPLANMLETCCTQDVIASLTGAGTKRLSNECEDNKAKRARTTPDVKSARKGKAQSSTPRVSTLSAKKTPKIEVNNEPSVRKDKSILDFMQKDSPSGDIFLSSKLSLLKREKNVPKKLEWDSDDDYECLADTVPANGVTADESDGTKAVMVDPDKKSRRKILTEEDLACTPQAVVKLVRISETEVQNGRVSPGEKAEPIENMARSKAKKEAKMTKSKRSLRHTEETTRSTHNVEHDEGPKGTNRKTRIKIETDAEDAERPSGRASKRLKKAVNYCEASENSNSSTPEKSESRPTRDIKLERAENGVKLKEATKERKATKRVAASDVAAATTAQRAGRRCAAKTPVEPPSDRAKRVTKPKVIFTMLDDPRLKQMVRALGGAVVEKIEAATVLVTTKIQRTLKLLTAISNSIPICSPDWLRACERAGEFVDPWDYLVQDGEAEAQWNFQLSASLQYAKEGKIFSGYTFLLLITLSADVIKGAIIANGGKAVSRKPSSGQFTVVATPSQRSKYEAYLKNGIWVISSEAILVSILRQKLDFEEFELK